MQREAVTVMPSCSGRENVEMASDFELRSFKKKKLFRMTEQLRVDISIVERQRCAIELCVRLGKSGLETLQLIHQAYADDAVRRAVVFNRWKPFQDGEK
jgi:hypothetical protein